MRKAKVFFVATPKVKMINVRLAPKVHDDFKTACELRGGSMSSLLHQYIVRTIREERELDPGAFQSASPMGTLKVGSRERKTKAG